MLKESFEKQSLRERGDEAFYVLTCVRTASPHCQKAKRMLYCS